MSSIGQRSRTEKRQSLANGVTAAQAEAAARALLANSGLPIDQVRPTDVQIVQPNAFWIRRDPHPQPGVARVAWICTMPDQRQIYPIWVDRETGLVIGVV